MITAWVFPGQDGFEANAGLGDEPAAVLELLDLASSLVGVPMRDRRARRRMSAFDTRAIQPLMTALCLGRAHDLPPPDVVAGSSLGELAAWAVACRVPAPDAVALAAHRGREMARAAAAEPGGMLAIRATESETTALLSEHPELEIGARNGPEDFVLTGPLGALSKLGGRRVPVTGAWHSRAMAQAAPALRAALPPAPRLYTRFVLNDAGRMARSGRDANAHLVRQLTHPADWYASMRRLWELGVRQVRVFGPARALRAQLSRIVPRMEIT